MEELIGQIVQRTGISEEHARQAAEVALTFVKSKLPEPLAAQIDGLVAGQTAGGGLGGMLGGLLG